MTNLCDQIGLTMQQKTPLDGPFLTYQTILNQVTGARGDIATGVQLNPTGCARMSGSKGT